MNRKMEIVDAEIVTPAGAEASPAGSVYMGGASFEDRNAALKAAAMAAGIRLQATIVPEGESLIPFGEAKKARLEAEVSALPTLAEGCAALVGALRGEQHVDATVDLSAVRMSPVNGGIFGEGSGAPMAYTHTAFSQLTQAVKPSNVRNGFAENMLALPPALRADVFNFHAGNARAGESVLRTYVSASGRRTLRAVASGRHSLESGDDLSIAEVLAAMPDGGKLRVTRSEGGSASTFEVLFPMFQRELKVGDVAMGALRITNSETKGAALRVEATLLQILCLNFTTAWAHDEEAEEISLRHVGDLSSRLPRAIRNAQKRIEPFVRLFGDAYRVKFPVFAQSRGEVLARVGKAFALSEGVLTEAAVVWDSHKSLTTGAERDTLAGVVNALTRAAQGEEMAAAVEVQNAAGKLVARGWAALA